MQTPTSRIHYIGIRVHLSAFRNIGLMPMDDLLLPYTTRLLLIFKHSYRSAKDAPEVLGHSNVTNMFQAACPKLSKSDNTRVSGRAQTRPKGAGTLPNWLNKRTRNRNSPKAAINIRSLVSNALENVAAQVLSTRDKVVQFDELANSLPDQVFRPTQYCIPFQNKKVVIVGGDVVQNADVISELEALGATIVEYEDTDRLLVDVIQGDVKGHDPAEITTVIAMIDYWPGRRNLLDFSLKIKSLIPTCRTAVASRFEAQDNFTKVGTPPIDGKIRLPLTGCSACRLTFQARSRAP
jgi:hypothetical protein